MKKAFIAAIAILILAGCVPETIKEAIRGNEETVRQDTETWGVILKSQPEEMWDLLLTHHKKTCDKCATIEDMKQHLLLREQAHWLRASKLKEWAND